MPPSSAVPRGRFSFETATVWSLVITLALAALVYIPTTTVPFLYTKVFILAIGGIIALAFFILARLTRGNLILPPMLMLGALWLPVLAYALSTFLSGANVSLAFFGDSFMPDTLGFMLILAVLGTLTALALRRPEHYRFFLRASGIATIVILAAQILIFILGQFPATKISASTSVVGTFNDLGALAGLVLISGMFALRLLPLSRKARLWLFIMGAAALAVLAVANISFVWGAIALIALGLFVEAVMRRAPGASDSDLDGVAVMTESDAGGSSGERSLAAPLVVLAISLFFLIGGNLGGALSTALHASVVDVRPSWQATLTTAKDVYGQSPIFGSGPGTFGVDWLRTRDATLNQTIFWNVDFPMGIGFLPTSFVTTGLVGAIAWIVLILAVLYLGVRNILLRSSPDPLIRFVTTGSFVAVVFLLVASIFLNVGAITLALLFVALGLFASVLRFAPGSAQWGVIFAKSPRVGFVIVFLLTLLLLGSIVSAYGFVERYVAQVNLARAAVALGQGDTGTALSRSTASISFAPSSAAYQVEAQVALSNMGKIANDSSVPADRAQQQFQQELANGITAGLAATKLDPNNYQNWLALGNLYAAVVPLGVDGAYDNAKAAFDKAHALNPTSPTILYGEAQLAIAHKDNAAAQTYLKQVIALKQDYTAAILLLSQLEIAAGNIKDARTSAEAAAYFTPNDPNVLFELGILRAAMGDTDPAIAALQGAVTADTQFANARYFLAALYAKKGQYADATTQLEAIAALSPANASAVADAVKTLKTNKNPFPANLLSLSGAPTSN